MKSEQEVQAHWEGVYQTKSLEEVSWTEREPQPSLQLIQEFAPQVKGPLRLLDLGAGASVLVDRLLEQNLIEQATLLDVSSKALALTRERLAEKGADTTPVQFIAENLLTWRPKQSWNLVHDRAVLHFLTTKDQRRQLVQLLQKVVEPGGLYVVATFGPQGPEQCSGLPVQRYSATELAELLGPTFHLLHQQAHIHTKPKGGEQAFQYAVFQRKLD